MKVVLISTYELGRQPFGLASPAAWLRSAGHEVTCADLAVGTLPTAEVREANLVAFYLPMHTATRLAAPLIPRVRSLNSDAHICCFGLYAPINESYLRSLGAETLLGGEFERALLDLANGSLPGQPISTERLPFRTPDRTGLPVLQRYPKLVVNGSKRRSGYTEASRGCKHLCRHCPVVPIYNGAFRVVPAEVVLADIAQQVRAGAEHVSFGDPDFFNGPAHARRLVEALHERWPGLTYDVTVKIEHLLQHRDVLPVLRRTGCLFVTSAVESIDDQVLARLDKGHTSADFAAVVRLFEAEGLTLAPTFIPFTPWTTVAGYGELLRTLVELRLEDHVAPVQLSLRLLIPAGSRLLELPDVREVVTGFDEAGLLWRWEHSQPAVDELARATVRVVHEGAKRALPRRAVFENLRALTGDIALPVDYSILPRTTIPFMEEPWFC